MIKYSLLLFLIIIVSISVHGANFSWYFGKNGNGKEWIVSRNLEKIYEDDGLYLHGVASSGIEITLKNSLDANKYKFFYYEISAAEYGGGYLYFAKESEEFCKQKRIRIPARGFYAKFNNSVDCSKNPLWKGQIKKLRFTPITRELDNVKIKFVAFGDNVGGIIDNGSFETAEPQNLSLPYKWKLLNGKAKIVKSTFMQSQRALFLDNNSTVENNFELLKEYDFSLSLAYKNVKNGKVILTFFDIFDKKISEQSLNLLSLAKWNVLKRRISPPKGSAFVSLKIKGKGEFDCVSAQSIIPEFEQYRWWNVSKWIWNKEEFNSAGKVVYFRKEFNIKDTKLIKSLKMQVATRNMGSPPPCDKVNVYINGKQIKLATPLLKWNWVGIYELVAHIRNGKNVIAFEVVNNMAPGGLNVDILLENFDVNNRFMRLGSNETFLSSTVYEKNWNNLNFNSKNFKKSRIRGMATPGSFARLPYRFLGTSGTIELKHITFPEQISTSKKYNISLDLSLASDENFKEILEDSALFFHLINEKKDVISKIKVLPITKDMLKKKVVNVSFIFDPQFLEKGKYTLRIYADRLAFSKIPRDFSINKTINFIEKKVAVIDRRITKLPVCKIIGIQETPRIVINNKEYSPLRFSHGAHTQNVTEKSFDIASKAYNQETRLMDVHISGTWEYKKDGTCDFSGYDTFFSSFLTRYPNTFFTIHWQLDTAGEKGPMRNWMLQNMSQAAINSKGSKKSGTYTGSHIVPSMASIAWQNEIVKVTKQFVKHIKNSPYANRIIGLMPSCGISYEWIYWGAQSKSFMDYSEPFKNGFRDYLRQKYLTIDKLNKLWKSNYKDFNQVEVPSENVRKNRKYKDFLLLEENQSICDLRIFLNTTVSDAILKVLKAVKEASNNKMLAGVYYGYSLYFCGPYFAPFSGHFALGRVLDSKDLDFLVSPCRYDDRASGGASGSMIPIGSLRKHNKLYVTEADNRLCHSWSKDGKIYDLRGSKSVIEREFAFALATNSGMEWLDFGEGWVPEDRRLVSVFENCQRVARQLATENKCNANDPNAIAVVVDEKAITRTAYDQRLFLNLVGIYPNLLRTGTSVHWYLLDELEQLEPYKMIIFTPTITQLNVKQIDFINRKLKNNNRSLVYLYSTGIYQNDKFAIENVGNLIGMPIKGKQHFSKRVLAKTDINDPILRDLPKHYSFGFAEPTEFYLYPVVSKFDKVLFTLKNSTLPGLVKRTLNDHKIIYSSSPGLSSLVIQNIAIDAGIKIFNLHKGDVTYGSNGFYAVYSLTGGKRIFNVPKNVAFAKELLSNKLIKVTNSKFEYDLKEHSIAMFQLCK